MSKLQAVAGTSVTDPSLWTHFETISFGLTCMMESQVTAIEATKSVMNPDTSLRCLQEEEVNQHGASVWEIIGGIDAIRMSLDSRSRCACDGGAGSLGGRREWAIKE